MYIYITKTKGVYCMSILRSGSIMRIAFAPPSENDFKHLFSSAPLRKGGGFSDISIFQPRGLTYRRRGGGILSFISGVAKRVLPFLAKTAAPAAREFGAEVVKDIIQKKKPIRQSLKKNGIKALKKTGLRILRGSGLDNKRKKRMAMKKKKRKRNEYIRDIFD